jgi:hypothetical protein
MAAANKCRLWVVIRVTLTMSQSLPLIPPIATAEQTRREIRKVPKSGPIPRKIGRNPSEAAGRAHSGMPDMRRPSCNASRTAELPNMGAYSQRGRQMFTTKNPINIIAAIGLGLGVVFGMAGTFVAQPTLQAVLWAIDGAGLVMAAALLSLKYFRMAHDIVAAGFMVFAIAEAVIMSGAAAGPAASVPSFAAGTALWVVALLLINIPKKFATPVRLLGVVSAILFFIVAARIFWGEQILPTSAPLPFYAYPFLVMTFVD